MSRPFPIVVHHNPACGTSRNVVTLIEAAGYTPDIILYLETGWTEPQLRALFAAADLTPRAALRTSKSPAAELGLLDDGVTEHDLVDAMISHPILVNRPLVATPRGIKLCRPSRSVLDLLDQHPIQPVFDEEGTQIWPLGET